MEVAAESVFNQGSPAPSRAVTPNPAGNTAATPNAHASSSHTVGSASTDETASEPGPSAHHADQPIRSSEAATLEQEVGQVVQQLSSWGGSLWGGFRKQSAFAFDTVKKDFSRTVQEAQDDLKKLQTQTVEVGLKDAGASLSEVSGASAGKGKAKDTESTQSESGLPTETNTVLPSVHVPTTQEAKDFFAKIGQTFSSQSNTINESIATLQKSLSESLASASANPQIQSLNLNKLHRSDINFAQFSSNIQKNLAQAGTMLNIQQAEKLAEEYLRKSEGLLHDAGEFLKDAVKVVPPEGGDGQGLAWDGSDLYSFSTAGYPRYSLGGRPSSDATRSASGEGSRTQLRKEALLRRLRADRELFMVDPAAETESPSRRAAFDAFKREIETKGGVEGEAFEGMIQTELDQEAKDVQTLKATRDELVPSQLTKQIFWTRYFFHKYAIEEEERKRQELLQATLEPQAEDFSWDEEDESPQSADTIYPAGNPASSPTFAAEHQKGVKATIDPISTVDAQASPSAQSNGNPYSSNTSERVSEESYVAISGQKAKPAAEPVVDVRKNVSKPEDDDEDDSDWE